MNTYAVIQATSLEGWGRVRRIEVVNTTPERDSRLTVVQIDGLNPMPIKGWFYDYTLQVFQEADPGLPPPSRVFPSPVRFWMEIFTATERAKVWALASGESIPGVTATLEQRYRLAAFRDITLSASVIVLTANEVVTVVNALESIGLLDPGRANEILNWNSPL